MKQLIGLTAALLLTFAAASAVSVSAQDPAEDGLNGCTADDCRVCNKNGLTCSPTATDCNCVAEA